MISGKVKGKDFLYSAVSSPLDRSKRFKLFKVLFNNSTIFQMHNYFISTLLYIVHCKTLVLNIFQSKLC